jgi:beta-mannosidase
MTHYLYPMLLFILLLSCQGQQPQPKKQKQLDENWKCSEAGKENWIKAKVPGVIHTDLLAAGKIKDPYYGTHEKELQWIEEKNWRYKSSFQLSKEDLERAHIDLVCKGLDSYAEISINGQLLRKTNNMFRSWRIDAKAHLKEGKNEIEILFRSPLEVNQSKVENLPYKLPAGSETGSLQVSPFTRKAPYHFGWDWGPRYLTAGIWRPIYLESWDDIRIKHLQLIQESLKEQEAELTVKIALKIAKAGNYRIAINEQEHPFYLSPEDSLIDLPYEIRNPKRWWPNGWGEAHLYPITVKVLEKAVVLDEQTEKIGLRSIELVREKDSIGTAFYFKVNGKRIFIKGANYIPQSNFLPSVSKGDYQKIIADAKAANMNMLRVWGGGIYENDIFYDLCDAAGILIWQDFMFAGSMYPGNEAFLNNVKKEVSENIIRLRNHPSIALWNGNNEMEVAWFNWGWQKSLGYNPEDSAKIWKDYQKIFHDLIPNQIKELDPQRAYTSTSPLSNWGTDENFNHHSMHYWGVWHGKDHFEAYRKYVGRFMAEYGFQSFPNMETIRSFAPDSALSLESEIMRWHQKSYVGNQRILEEARRYFPEPINFADFVEKSQKTQALGMRMAIDAHRLARNHCGGTLFWQWNDCWPGPSWSARDYYARPKQLMKDLPTLFAPIALIPRKKDKQIEIHLVNDGLEEEVLNIKISAINKAEQEVYSKIIKTEIDPNTSNDIQLKLSIQKDRLSKK